MKATELRIGNLVNGVLTQKPYIIDAWALREMESGNYQNSQDTETKVFEPIPLTEEWLLKFGFCAWDDKKTIYTLTRTIDKYNTDCFRFWFKSDKLVFDYIQDEVHPTDSIYDDKNIIRLNIKYVHTLQNLYFALTGEELKLKEDESKTD